MSAAFALVLPAAAAAKDRWTQPHPGVRHLRRVQERVDVHVVAIDLRLAEIAVVATRPEDRAMSVREFGRRYDVDIAVNANYFNGRSRSCGLAAGDGKVWRDSYQDGCEMSFGFGPLNQVLAFESGPLLAGPLPRAWMTEVVTGKPWLVRDGIVQTGWDAPRHIWGHHPRTALGLSRDRKTLFLVVADGRRRGARGMSGTQLAELFVELGAANALNMDGGGSSELWIRKERGVQNKPSDGRGRSVGNHLGIRVRRSIAVERAAQGVIREERSIRGTLGLIMASADDSDAPRRLTAPAEVTAAKSTGEGEAPARDRAPASRSGEGLAPAVALDNTRRRSSTL